ncbi:MAG: peptidylprolyl isomerase [Bacteroidota bacterium]|nr:peptidylprolyl isomerase [Bacteroidota bacterium]
MTKFLLTIVVFASIHNAISQKTIDKIVAVVGDKSILLSDVETQKLQAIQQGLEVTEQTSCMVLDELMFQQLLVHQAEIDSLEVTEDMVKTELDQRIQYFAAQIGGIPELEEFYGKSIEEIKDEFYIQIEDRMKAQKMQQEISGSITVSPKEVKEFFNSFPEDSIPFINSKVQVSQIVIEPKIDASQKKAIKKKLEKIRSRIINNEISFSVAAEFYSCDPGTQSSGGNFGWVNRGDFVPQFDAVAFNVPLNTVSEIFESSYGFHIALIEKRRGEQYYGSHILLCKQVSENQLAKVKSKLETVRSEILSNSVSWEESVIKHSTDDNTKGSMGVIFNESTGSMYWDMQEIDKQVFLGIKNLGVGEISQPIYMESSSGDFAYRLLKLIDQTEPHKANIQDDYQMIQGYALSSKQYDEIALWVNERVNSTFIKINDDFNKCKFNYNWIKKH